MTGVEARALPPGWIWARLGDLGTWVGGGTPDTSKDHYWHNGTIPWVSPKDMKTSRIVGAEDMITPEAVAASATNLVPRGSVLIVTRSGILRHSLPVAFTDVDVALNQDLKALLPCAGLDPAYVALAVSRFAWDILKDCAKHGTTVQSIEQSRLLEFQLPIAPIPEQRRIVARLDELFSKLDAAEAALREARKLLRSLYQSVLNTMIFDALQTHARQNTPTEQVGELLVESMANGISVKGHDQPPGHAALRLNALADGSIDYAQVRYIDIPPERAGRLSIRTGDFLVSRANGSVRLCGIAALVRDVPGPVVFPDTIIRLRFNPRRIDNEYALLVWGSNFVRTQIESKAKTSAGIHKISQSDIGSIELPVPDIARQRQLADRAMAQLLGRENLRSAVSSLEGHVDALRQSILAAAFRGGLDTRDAAAEPALDTLAIAQATGANVSPCA